MIMPARGALHVLSRVRPGRTPLPARPVLISAFPVLRRYHGTGAIRHSHSSQDAPRDPLGYDNAGESSRQDMDIGLDDWNDEGDEGMSRSQLTDAEHVDEAGEGPWAGATDVDEKEERIHASSTTSPSPPLDRPRLPTSMKKLNRLLGRQKLGEVPEHELKETFVRGSGPGGQAINKTSSSVSLIHLPTGVRVQAQPTRSREQNRRAARRILAEKLDMMIATGVWTREAKPSGPGRSVGGSSAGAAGGKYAPAVNADVNANDTGNHKVANSAASSGGTTTLGTTVGDIGATAKGDPSAPVVDMSVTTGPDVDVGVGKEKTEAGACTDEPVPTKHAIDGKEAKRLRKADKKAAELHLAGQWSRQEIQWEKERRRKANRSKKVKRKKKEQEHETGQAEQGEGAGAEEVGGDSDAKGDK